MSVLAASNGETPHAAGSNTVPDWNPVASWKRCVESYRLEPSYAPEIPTLTQSEIVEARNAFGDENLALIIPELERVLSIVGAVGYNATLADAKGLILVEMSPDDPAHACISDKEGMIWTEENGGTNGIGSTLIEQRATSVYKADHFCVDLINQSCVAAPVRDADGRIRGVINLATRNADITESAHRVIYQLAQDSACRLEAKLFRARFPNDCVLQFERRSAPAVMVSMGEDGQVLGATRSARTLFGLNDCGDVPTNLWDVFDRAGEAALRSSNELHATALRLLSTGRRHRVAVWHGRRIEARSFSSGADGHKPERNTRAERNYSVSIAEWAGEDRQMQGNVKVLRKLQNSGIPVLLLGETGTGKDTLAKAIHAESARASQPFVAFNCAAVPESLIDSELFGYSRGAFTGANREGNVGRLVEAHGGTIFLDEVGDMPLALQTRLLRVLESGEVTPLGSGRSRIVDLQVIAATNHNLRTKVMDGLFREDLFYRLAGVVIDIPPLRERDDIERIARAILARCTEGKPLSFDEGALSAIRTHRWPGNVRELRHVIQRAVKLCEGGVIREADLLLTNLPLAPRRPASSPAAAPSADPAQPARANHDAHAQHTQNTQHASPDDSVRDALANAERTAIVRALEKHGNNIDAAAQALSMSRATIYRKLKRYDIRL
jgi:sigma-54 dependent transcriptional regulator, acetoin dehydrogenase operon transcriptional activator AcoR